MSTGVKVAAVVGVGPGLGRALAVRFARGGFAVALVARQEPSLERLPPSLAKRLTSAALTCPQPAAPPLSGLSSPRAQLPGH